MSYEKNKHSGLAYVLKTIGFFILFFLLWNLLGEIDYKRCAKGKAPLFPINVVTNQYENGNITQYYCLGYKVVEYQLENKKNEWEYISSLQSIDTANLVDKYLDEKNNSNIVENNLSNNVIDSNIIDNNLIENSTEENTSINN